MEATNTTLYISNLQDGVTQEFVYKEFKKHGQIKTLKYYPKIKCAYVEYTSAIDASNAKRTLNYIPFLDKEINIQFYSDSQQRKNIKMHNLFIKNVPEDLDQKHLHQFLTTFGEVFSLQLKKNEEGKNLGYGYVQFDTQEGRDKVLAQQAADNGKLVVGKFQIILEKFSKFQVREHQHTTIHLRQFFENEIPDDQKEMKKQEVELQLNSTVEKLFQNQKVSVFVSYNVEKKNFWAQLGFEGDSKDELNISEKLENLKQCLQKLYPTLDCIIKQEFQQKELSEKNLICLGVREEVSELIFINWIKVNLPNHDVKTAILVKKRNPTQNEEQQQKQKKVYSENTQIAHLHFYTEQQGIEFLKFCANKKNKAAVDEIFDTPKITLLLDAVTKKEYEKTKKAYETDKKQFDESKKAHIPESKQTVTNQSFVTNQFNPMLMMMNQYNIQNMKQMMFQPQLHQQAPQQFMPFRQNMNQIPQDNNRNIQKPTQPPNVTRPAQPPRQQQQQQQQVQQPVQGFEQFSRLSVEHKAAQIEEITEYLIKNQEEFNKLDEHNRRNILGQIIFYKISKLDTQSEIVGKQLNIQDPAQIKQKIEDYINENAKITGMLIDSEVFDITDTIEFIEKTEELIDRCEEAINLIRSQQQHQQ